MAKKMSHPWTGAGLVTALLALSACSVPQPHYVYAQPACYRTLASVDCHSAPLAGEESRRVGHYQAPVN